jgi:Ca-activated chloride channel family protein
MDPRRAGVACALCLSVVPVWAQIVADPPVAAFRSTVSVVSIPVLVRDPRGRVVRNLTARDFEVRDNGLVRPILDFQWASHAPVSLALLLDMSGSMRLGLEKSLVSRAYHAVLDQLREHDEAAIFTFDAALQERHGFTSSASRLKKELPVSAPFGTTSLYDATAATARRLAERQGRRRAVIVLTDGVDTSSRATASEVSALASSIDAPVYIVVMTPFIDRRGMEAAAGRTEGEAVDLRNLADWTGGQLVFASTPEETALVAGGIVSELREGYVLAIESGPLAEWHRLEVTVKRRSLSVQARSGYFGG